MMDNIVGRVLQRLGIENDLYQQWQGPEHRLRARQRMPRR